MGERKSPRQRRNEFAESAKRASLLILGLGAVLIGYAFYSFINGGWSNPIFAIEYPIALGFVIGGLALYVAYQFDKNLHEHLDEIQSNLPPKGNSEKSEPKPP